MVPHRGQVDPVSRIIARNVYALLDVYDWSVPTLADMIGMERSRLWKYLAIAFEDDPEFKVLPVWLVLEFARIFNKSVEELSRDNAAGEARDPTIKEWNLSIDPCGELDEEYKKHNQYKKRITAFYNSLPFCAITPEVLSKRLLAQFGERAGTPRGERIVKGFQEYGAKRYFQYIGLGKHQIPEINAYLSREGWLRFRNGDPPFNICPPEEMIKCIEHLRECIEQRRFQVRILDLGKGELERRVEGADSIVYFHGRGIMRIESNQRIFFYDQYLKVMYERDLLDHLDLATGPDCALDELATFQLELEKGTHPLCRRESRRPRTTNLISELCDNTDPDRE